MISLSSLMVIPALGAIALLAMVGIGLQRMVAARSRLRQEYRRRQEVRLRAARVRAILQPKLRPLGLKRVPLESFRQRQSVQHRRRLNLHIWLK